MIVTRAPFRVTLGGGGTDLPSYYEKHGGFILAMGIDKYMYVSINPPVLDRKIRLQYTKSETVDHPDQLIHELAREALKRTGIFSRMEVSSMADLPSGTGLGSSGCYLVALLTALRRYCNSFSTVQAIAEEACDIELNVLGKSIGKQDQYTAAFGGMTVLEIARDGRVDVRRARVNRSSLPDFQANTQLYFTGVRRNAPQVLRDQDAAMRSETAPVHDVVQDALHGIKDTGHRILAAIETENYDEFGRLMDVHWQCKKRLSSRVSIPGIDELYAQVKERFGVLGGKVSGAGGGGFFMVYAPKQHEELAAFMRRHGLERMGFELEFDGARVIGESGRIRGDLVDHGPVA